MLEFKKIRTALGIAYQAFSADNSLVYTVHRTRSLRDAHGYRLHPWTFTIRATRELVPGLWIADVSKSTVKHEGIDSRGEAYTYCRTFDSLADLSPWSSERNRRAWDAVYADVAA